MDEEKKALLPKDGQDEEKLLINNEEPPFALTMTQKLFYGLPFIVSFLHFFFFLISSFLHFKLN